MAAYVCGHPDALDAAWMTQALEEAGIAGGAIVTGMEFSGYVGTGQMSRNGRFQLTWDRPEGRPASVIGKFPSDDPPTRAGSFASGVYRSETSFYRDVVATVDVRTPACWVARIDEVEEQFVLIMEDLVDSVQGDQFTGCSSAELALAIEQAVALHAPRWGDPTLADAVALQPADGDRAERLTQYYRDTFQGCLARLGDRFDADVVELVRRFDRVTGPWTQGPGTPHTIVHGDFRPDNFLFGCTPSAPPIAVVDWQTVSKGLGICDVAYLLGGALPLEERRLSEQELVENYRSRMNARGIDYSAADCWRDYRWGTFQGVFIAVCATMMAERTERGDEMFTLMISRHARHALDLDALSLVESTRG